MATLAFVGLNPDFRIGPTMGVEFFEGLYGTGGDPYLSHGRRSRPSTSPATADV